MLAPLASGTLRLLVLSFAFQFAFTAAADPGASLDSLLRPRVVKKLTPLKPQTFNQPSAQTDMHSQRVISGLLYPEERACKAGYGLCSTGYCCQLGGDCCTEGGCCDAGDWCYSTFCCKLSQDGCDSRGCCAIGDNCCEGGGCCSSSDYCIITDGIQACCPIGEVCSGISNQCDESGFVPCSNEDFCCKPGETCFRDSAGNPGCKSGGGGGGGVTTTTKTTATTHTATPTTTTGTTANAPTSVPAPPSGSSNVVIDVTVEEEITWTGDWSIVDSTCKAGANARKCTGDDINFNNGMLEYSFTGTAIYVSLWTTNAQYTIFLDDDFTAYGDSEGSNPAATPKNCTFGWSKTGLSAGSHYLSISLIGPVVDLRRDAKRDSGSPYSLEIQSFTITQSDGTSSSGGSAAVTGG
ncbi:hypothetical protein C8F01DRAFT_1367404 [Mycena amicta]|nr:hypothetical protein C8F01DRAFT_1367404 [Mycena amicta]